MSDKAEAGNKQMLLVYMVQDEAQSADSIMVLLESPLRMAADATATWAKLGVVTTLAS